MTIDRRIDSLLSLKTESIFELLGTSCPWSPNEPIPFDKFRAKKLLNYPAFVTFDRLPVAELGLSFAINASQSFILPTLKRESTLQLDQRSDPITSISSQLSHNWVAFRMCDATGQLNDAINQQSEIERGRDACGEWVKFRKWNLKSRASMESNDCHRNANEIGKTNGKQSVE